MIQFVKGYDLGDFASILGVLISVIGFAVTIIGVTLSKRAAEQAREQVRQFENIVDFSSTVATLEEIKRLHRQGNAWQILPDRYALIRKVLIQLRVSSDGMTDNQKTIIQNAIANLMQIEKLVERALVQGNTPKADKLNAIISTDIDGLVTVLNQLKNQPSGVSG